jgi:hypothetical protein
VSGTNTFTDSTVGPTSIGVGGTAALLGTSSFTLNASMGLVVGGTLSVNSGGTLIQNGATISAGIFSISGLFTYDSGGHTFSSILVNAGGTLSATNFTVNAGENLTQSGGALSITALVNNGSTTINGTVSSITTISGTGSTAVGATGSLTITGFTQASLISNGTTTINGTGTLGSISGSGALKIGAVGNLALSETQSTSNIGSLTIATGGTFDITNNALVISYSAAGQSSPDAAIRAALVRGSGTNGTAYNGTGIISSVAARLNAALVANGGTPAYGVGYADGSDPYLNGEGPAAGTEEVKLTLLGDLNLDGVVNSADFILFADSFGQTGGAAAAWDHGDLNYDGSVNSADFILFADNFGKSLGSVSGTGGGLTLAEGGLDAAQVDQFNAIGTDLGISSSELATLDLKVAAVPEPGSAGLLVIGGFGLMSRRWRKLLR